MVPSSSPYHLLAKAVYSFNAISIKIPIQFFSDVERKKIQLHIEANTKIRLSKTILNEANTKIRLSKTILNNKRTGQKYQHPRFQALLQRYSNKNSMFLAAIKPQDKRPTQN